MTGLDRNAIRRLAAALVISAAVVAAGFAASRAPGQDLQQRLGETQQKLDQATRQEGVLTTRISHESAQIDRLTTEVAGLRNKEAAAAAELAQKQAELDTAQAQLEALKERLRAAIKVLEARLVAIYKSNEPDLFTVALQSDGWDDLLNRTEYIQHLNDQDNEIVSSVRDLRNQMQVTVNAIRAARDVIAQRKAELEATRTKLASRKNELAAARQAQHKTLEEVRAQKQDLEGDLSDISEKIAEQLGSGSGELIWPVDGPVVSGFGMRWGRMHEGIDIAVPTGTPIRAAKSGTVEIAGSEGGYGNYTCIDHGGGLSTCYAHQEQILVSTGQQVAQAQIIGITDCTGHCLGPHVHFEVRVNGQAVDPLGYL
jgi:murein DD-endopeptidase MepM/ murein hydrolase activator NlpD